jgi:uridine kinase
MLSSTFEFLIGEIAAARARVPADRSAVVAISGIDASGKGHVASGLTAALAAADLRVALIGLGGFLRAPRERFAAGDPAGHFYRHGFRFDELFGSLVLPLRDRRSWRFEPSSADRVYAFDEIDVVLLEGIFLLKRELRAHYDVSFWIDCTFATALERAIARGQEGMDPDETRLAYDSIYFPAQVLHCERDDPKGAANHVVVNDPRLPDGPIGARA